MAIQELNSVEVAAVSGGVFNLSTVVAGLPILGGLLGAVTGVVKSLVNSLTPVLTSLPLVGGLLGSLLGLVFTHVTL